MICNHEWRAPVVFKNSSGEKFESLPVNHICAESYGHVVTHSHKCGCGETTPNVIET
jgi:hypothetical protein